MEEEEMKVSFSTLLLAVLVALTVSCSRDATFTVSSAYQGRVAVAEDKDTMERIIDCAITQNGDHLSAMELLPKGTVFRVATGTKVRVEGFTFSSSRARKIRILEGEYSGKEGWVYAASLRPDTSIQQASAGH